MAHRSWLVALCGLVLASLLPAHGGQYRGPGGGTPGAPVPGGLPGGPTTGGGLNDLSKWQAWWEVNKDPYIRLREAVHAGAITTGSDEFFMGGSRREEAVDSLEPSRRDIHDRVLPALKRAIDGNDQRDIVSACIVAMAKAGIDHDEFAILPIIRSALPRPDQEIRETAALAMGISGKVQAIDDLIALALDRREGRALVQQSHINYRTRSFAAYGLGLIGHAVPMLDLRRKIADALTTLLNDRSVRNQDPRVAAINAMRLLRPQGDLDQAERTFVDDCVETLWSYYGHDYGRDEQLVQAHVPPAIATLLGRGNPAAEPFKKALARELSGKVRRSILIYRAAPLALGVLCQPREVQASDAEYSDALLRYYREGRDQQTRYFCLIALGRIGGAHNRSELLKAFVRGNDALEKPWAALALGIMTFAEAEARGAHWEPDIELGRALHAAFKEIKNDQTRSAIAIALGLSKYRQAADDLLRALADYESRDELAGYLCVSLALMGAREAIPDIHDLVLRSERRPDRLKQAAIALGKLGDKRAAETLQKMLLEGSNSLAKLSAIASALGLIGDRRSIDPLIEVLENEDLAVLSRAFAAVALGNVVDKELLPWNSKIAVDSNYSAQVETLSNGATGILDIL